MINGNRNFNVNGTIIPSEELKTQDHLEFVEKFNLDLAPIVPIHKEYINQNQFSTNKYFLMQRLLNGGFPHSQLSFQYGKTHSLSSAVNIFSRIFKKSQYEGTPAVYSPIILNEIESIGKCIKLPVDHIRYLNHPDKRLLDPVMVVIDMWEQNIQGLEKPLTFITAYAHINELPENWYTQIHLYIYQDKLYLYPENVITKKTIKPGDKHRVFRNVLLDASDLNMLKALGKGLVTTDPVWTCSEEIFELQAPMWFNRFKRYSKNIFDSLKTTSDSLTMFMISEPVNVGFSKIMTAFWITRSDDKGSFNGYVYDHNNNRLVYGTFDTSIIDGVVVSDIVAKLVTTDINEDVVDCNLIYRPGFKFGSEEFKKESEIKTDKPKEPFGAKLDMSNITFQQPKIIKIVEDDVEIKSEGVQIKIEPVTE